MIPDRLKKIIFRKVVSLRELVLHRGMSVRCVEKRVNVINDWGYLLI
jgi:hypothetical protein